METVCPKGFDIVYARAPRDARSYGAKRFEASFRQVPVCKNNGACSARVRMCLCTRCFLSSASVPSPPLPKSGIGTEMSGHRLSALMHVQLDKHVRSEGSADAGN